MKPIARACVLCGFWAYTSAHAALAQQLSDPTRPPNVSGASTAEGDEEAPRQLQSVLLSPRRKVAVIDGKVVALGGHVGDGVVSKISETEVVLSFPDHTETLKLLGGIQRKPVRSAARKGSK